jgi:hypothetical protein
MCYASARGNAVTTKEEKHIEGLAYARIRNIGNLCDSVDKIADKYGCTDGSATLRLKIDAIRLLNSVEQMADQFGFCEERNTNFRKSIAKRCAVAIRTSASLTDNDEKADLK